MSADAATWTVWVPQPAAWLTANIDRHPYQRAGLVKAWRKATVTACYAARLPQDITPVTIAATICYTRAQPPVRDRLNLAPTIKAVVDALTPARTITRQGKTHYVYGYGLLPDDADRHVLDTTWQLLRSDRDGIQLVIATSPETIQQQALFDIHHNGGKR